MRVNRATRMALIALGIVVVALAAYAYPSPPGVASLIVKTLAILGALAVFAILIAGSLGKRPIPMGILLGLTLVGVLVTSWAQVAAVYDARKLETEIAAAGLHRLLETIAAGTTKAAGLVRQFLAIDDPAAAEIATVLAGGDDPALAGLLDTERVLDPAALRAGAEALPALATAAAAAPAEIARITLAEAAAVDAMDVPLPDSARILFLYEARIWVESASRRATTLAGIEAGRLDVTARLVAFLEARPGAYAFDAALRRPRFADPVDDAAYAALAAELTTLAVEAERLRAAAGPERAGAIVALVEAAGATP